MLYRVKICTILFTMGKIIIIIIIIIKENLSLENK